MAINTIKTGAAIKTIVRAVLSGACPFSGSRTNRHCEPVETNMLADRNWWTACRPKTP